LGFDYVYVFVDNNWPHAVISQIYYYNNGSTIAVDACAIVQGTNDQFGFVIDASDQIGQNLMSWVLYAVWGNDQSEGIDSDSYNPNHVSISKKWLGPYLVEEPPAPTYWHATVEGDPTSRQCAHTFILGVWDRSTNGWGYLHYSSYTQSITLLLS